MGTFFNNTNNGSKSFRLTIEYAQLTEDYIKRVGNVENHTAFYISKRVVNEIDKALSIFATTNAAGFTLASFIAHLTSDGIALTGVGAPVGVPASAVTAATTLAGAFVTSGFATGVSIKTEIINASSNNGSSGGSGNAKMTTKEATEAAKKLGYDKVNEKSHGQPVFKNAKNKKPKYITPDVDMHNGGVWKGADSVKDLGSKSTRLGTYDANLNRIGD